MGGYKLKGHKRWTTNATVADYMVVLCNMDDTLTVLLVDMSSDGVRSGEPDRNMGNHCHLTAEVCFDDVFIPQEHLVGQQAAA